MMWLLVDREISGFNIVQRGTSRSSEAPKSSAEVSETKVVHHLEKTTTSLELMEDSCHAERDLVTTFVGIEAECS